MKQVDAKFVARKTAGRCSVYKWRVRIGKSIFSLAEEADCTVDDVTGASPYCSSKPIDVKLRFFKQKGIKEQAGWVKFVVHQDGSIDKDGFVWYHKRSGYLVSLCYRYLMKVAGFLPGTIAVKVKDKVA